MDLHQLRYFLEVAQTLHFSKAAEQLNTAQSALSRQIQQLEDEWGVQLFERDKRNVRLTATGSYLRQEANRLLNLVGHIRRQVQHIHRGEAGELRIAYPGSAIYSILPNLLKQFYDSFPNVQVSLQELLDVELLKGLLDLSIDIGFTRETVHDTHLQSWAMVTEPISIVVQADHWLNDTIITDLTRLAGERFILPPRYAGAIYHDIIVQLLTQIGSPLHTVLESNFGSTILHLIDQGLGISILPYSYHKAASNRLRFIQLTGAHYQTTLYMVWRRDDPNPVVKNWLGCIDVLNR